VSAGVPPSALPAARQYATLYVGKALVAVLVLNTTLNGTPVAYRARVLPNLPEDFRTPLGYPEAIPN